MSEGAKRTERRTVVGVVTSDKGDKCITISVDRKVLHPRFKKYVKRRSTYHAHDENNEAHVGDRVSIASCRPLSKTKTFRLVEVLEKSRLRQAASAGGSKSEG